MSQLERHFCHLLGRQIFSAAFGSQPGQQFRPPLLSGHLFLSFQVDGTQDEVRLGLNRISTLAAIVL